MAEGGSLGWGGGELGLQIWLPFCCLLGSQMQFIDNMRGTERGDGEQGVPEYRIPLKVSANFMRMRPFCHYVGYLHTNSTHTHGHRCRGSAPKAKSNSNSKSKSWSTKFVAQIVATNFSADNIQLVQEKSREGK